MSEWVYIGAAYGLTWVVLLGYWQFLARRVWHAEIEGGGAP